MSKESQSEIWIKPFDMNTYLLLTTQNPPTRFKNWENASKSMSQIPGVTIARSMDIWKQLA